MTANSQRTSNGTKKVSTARKTSTAKKTNGRKPQTKNKRQTSRKQSYNKPGAILRDEIILWAILAVSVIILISNFNLGGSLGQKISSLFFGVFGFMAYIVPFILFFTTAFIISNKQNTAAWRKTISVYAFLISLCSIFELVVNSYDPEKKILEFYQFSSKYKTGGGLAGGLLCKAFCPTVGIVGAYVLIIIMMLICIVLITERSLFAGMKNKTSRVYENARKDVSRRKEISTAKREQRDMQRDLQKQQELKEVLDQIRAETAGVVVKPRNEAAGRKRNAKSENRLGKKISGVSMDTALQGSDNTIAEVHEVIPSVPPSPAMAQIDFTIQRNDGVAPATSAESGGITIMDADPAPDMPDLSDMPETEPDNNASDIDFVIKQSRADAGDKEMEPVIDESIFDVKDEPAPVMEPVFESTPVMDPMEEEKMPDITVPKLKLPDAAPPSKANKSPKSSPAEVEAGIQSVEQEMEITAQVVKPEYVFPSIDLLKKPKRGKNGDTDKELRETAIKLQTTLHSFGVDVTVTNVSCGPSVTRYELTPQQGVKVSRIVNLADDIKLNLAAADIRIEAPIPGKSAVGIEVPNHENSAVMLRELLESDDFKNHPSNLAFAAGKDIAGKVVVTDIARMPHLLIAGATGSGKSVCINTIIMSILYKAKPEDVKLIMIDPKVVELSVYNGIPHLMIPVVTDPKKAAGALNWGVAEMTERYKKFADLNVRDLKGYNAKIESVAHIEDENKPEKLPQIIIIVDELADLMMVAPGEVEDSICRLAQLARAAGIHLIIATQRPSVNVITGLIKANMPSRIAFSVSSGVDSRTIIDMNGAEKLLGKGDMLFYPQGYQKPARVQGAFVSDSEVGDVVEFLAQKNMSGDYNKEVEEQISKVQQAVNDSSSGGTEVDAYFADAGKFIIEKDKASIGMLQRVFKIGFNRAARIMDQLADAGVVGEEEGTKPRKVIMSMEEFENYIDEYI